MSTINPNVGPANASLSSPLITPGYPMVGVEKANPSEPGTGVQDGTAAATKRNNAVHQSGNDGNRSL